MKNKLIAFVILGIFIVGIFLVGFTIMNVHKKDTSSNKIYLGPVPQNCDEQYFRETGITKCTNGVK